MVRLVKRFLLVLAFALAPGFALAGDAVTPAQGNGVSSQALDTLLGSMQGAIAVRGSSGWTGLGDVATGQVLTSGGVGAAPVYTGTPSLTSLTLSSGLTLTGATITGAPTWSSGQTFPTLVGNTTITAGVTGSSTGSLMIKGTTSGSTTITVAAAAGSPATWTLPTATAAAGAALTDVAGNGTLSWVVPTAAVPTLGAVVNAGNAINGTAASGQLTWTTGGTYAAGATAEIVFPSDVGAFINPASGATGQSVTITGGVPTSGAGGGINLTATAGVGTNRASGSIALSVSTGSGVGSATAGSITGTAGQSVTGTAGAITWTAGAGGSTSGNGGIFSGIGGAGNGSSALGGAANLTGGAGGAAAAGGSAIVSGGSGGSGVGLSAILTAFGGNGSGSGGNGSFFGGAAGSGLSNISAGSLTIGTGLPTGTGTANINIQSGFTLVSGSTTQAAGDRFYVAGHNITMSNTTTTATGIVVLNVPVSNSGGGCMVIYQLVATDGTNYNTATGSFTVSCSNKAGTVTATTAAITDESSNANTGTLSAGAVTTTIASQAVTIKIAPTFTGIAPTSVVCSVTIVPFGRQVTVSPQ